MELGRGLVRTQAKRIFQIKSNQIMYVCMYLCMYVCMCVCVCMCCCVMYAVAIRQSLPLQLPSRTYSYPAVQPPSPDSLLALPLVPPCPPLFLEPSFMLLRFPLQVQATAEPSPWWMGESVTPTRGTRTPQVPNTWFSLHCPPMPCTSDHHHTPLAVWLSGQPHVLPCGQLGFNSHPLSLPCNACGNRVTNECKVCVYVCMSVCVHVCIVEYCMSSLHGSPSLSTFLAHSVIRRCRLHLPTPLLAVPPIPPRPPHVLEPSATLLLFPLQV